MSVPCFSGLEELVWDLPSFVWEVNGLLPSHPSTSIKVVALGLFLLIRILLMNHGVQVMLGRVWKDVGLSPNKGVVTGLAMCELVGFNFLIAWMAIGIHTWVKGLFIRFVRNSVWRVQVTCTALIKKSISFFYSVLFWNIKLWTGWPKCRIPLLRQQQGQHSFHHSFFKGISSNQVISAAMR